MDRTLAKKLMDRIETDLQPLAKEYGLTIRSKHGSIGQTDLIVKLEVAEQGENGVALTREARDFKMLANVYGLEPSDLGREFSDFTGKTFKITGLAARSDKYPILATRNGKGYKFPGESVKLYLSRQRTGSK